MKNVKGVVLLLLLSFVGLSFVFAQQEVRIKKTVGYIPMHTLVYDVAKQKYVSYSKEEFAKRFGKNVSVSTCKEDLEKYKYEYTKNNGLDIRVLRVEFPKDGKYVYVYAELYAMELAYDDQ